MSLLPAKQSLRKEMLFKRNSLSATQLRHDSDLIHHRLVTLPQWKKARTIACYMPLPGEVDTRGLIEQAWKNKQLVCLPKIKSHSFDMAFYALEQFDDLKQGPYGLMQPSIGKEILAAEIDLMIVPGLAFDLHGHRLGFGKGYYDRYLKTYKGMLLALAFDWQLVPQVPHDAHDQIVQMIATPSAVYDAQP